MLLAKMRPHTYPLHTGMYGVSLSSRLLPRTTVHRVLLANTRLHAFTWLVVEIADAKQPREQSDSLHDRLEGLPVKVFAVSGNVPAAGEYEARRRACVVEDSLRRSQRVLVYPQGTSTASTPSHPSTGFLITGRSFVAPGKTVIRPLNPSSLPTLRSRQTPTTS